MKQQDYNVSITVDATAEEAFNAINNVSGWWTTHVEGNSIKLDDVFTVRFGETFMTMKIVEFIPEKKIVWEVIDCYKHWLKDKKEWLHTKMNWEISSANNTTQVSFTHIGLVPGIECYNGCEGAWNQYIQQSLLSLITTGKGQPTV